MDKKKARWRANWKSFQDNMFITYYSFTIAITAQIYEYGACKMPFGYNMVKFKYHRILCSVTHSQ